MSSITGPIWTKQAKLEGGLDPLGLDRASDRLTGELMPGVTVNVNLARYFSLFTWLFATTKADNQDDLLDEIVRAEKIYALGSYLAHDGERCANGVAGSDLVASQWDVKQQINLDKIKWLSNGGVYRGLYKGPLFKLGLLATNSKGKVTVTNFGQSVAQAFDRSVGSSEWAKKGRARPVVTRSEIQGFGNRSCPCSLSNSPSELNALRQLFFETNTREGKVLSQSLGFILSLVDQCERFEFQYLDPSFRLAMYYRKIYNDKDRIVNFKVLNSLDGIVTRWRSFQAHDYFSFALESLFSIWLEIMFAQPSQRLTLQQFMDRIDGRVFITTINKHLGLRLSIDSLHQLTLDKIFTTLLKRLGLSDLTAQNSIAFDKLVNLGHEFSEETLGDSVFGRYKAGRQYSERCAEAVLLLLVLYVRFYYQHLQGPNQPGWDRYEAMVSQSKSDLGLPGFFGSFPLDGISPTSVYDFLGKIMNYYVIQQSLVIREERNRDLIWFSEAGFAGLGEIAPLTQVYQYHFPFDNYRYYRNSSKLNNAMALLGDIEYISIADGFWKLTRDGRNRLKHQFES